MAVKRFGFVETFDATVEPTLRQGEAFLSILVVALPRRTLVKGHHDICADDSFRVHHVLRREDMSASVDVGLESASLFCQLSDACKRENLKPTAIRQDRTFPTIEAMKAAGASQDVKSGAQI